MVSDSDKSLDYRINVSTYDWSVRVFNTLKKLLSVNLKLHSSRNNIENGDILLFNHFARFETFIPQYLIYEETGAYCSSVASSEFFEGDEVMANFLRSVGAIPHDHERLLPLLAEQILRGRKIIIFPEGGMVKDRQVMDDSGAYNIFSRTAMDRRKQHTGAAVLGLGLNAFKYAIKQQYYMGNEKQLQRWADDIGLDGISVLLEAALRPTHIIPSNITFYPIRVGDNMLRKGAELINSGLTRRHSEELLIEGNILLKDTDMDVRLGEPVEIERFRHSWERHLLYRLASTVEKIDDVFTLDSRAKTLINRVVARQIRRNAGAIRDEYMHKMYSSVTVNLSHLASLVIMAYAEKGENEIRRDTFHKALYLSIKGIQKIPSIYLHRSLKNPSYYDCLIDGRNDGLEQFMSAAESSGLIHPFDGSYRLLPKLLEISDFDNIRMENPIVVYANEVEPLPSVAQVINQNIEYVNTISQRELAELKFDDEIVSWQWDKAYFSKPCFEDINKQETMTQDPKPFFLLPKKPNGYGVVLIHGFLASPAEVRGFADLLVKHGYSVVGVRLKGHGTSPRELREQKWEDWFGSLKRSYRIMQDYVDWVFLVGFSTGGALALRLAADQPDGLLGTAVISVPIKFRDTGMMLVPLLHGTNKLVQWLSSYEGIKAFQKNIPEHPDINYRNIPIRGLYELRRLVRELEDRLHDVHCPSLVIQADNDPTVDPKSADIILKALGAKQVELLTVNSDRHGILYENIGGTQDRILTFLDRYKQSHKENPVI